MDGRAHLFQTGGEGGPGLVQGGGGAVAVNGAKRTICQLVDISIQVAGVPLEAPSSPRLSSVRTKLNSINRRGILIHSFCFQEWTISYKHMRTTRKKREKIPFAFIVKARFFFLVFVFIEGDGELKKKSLGFK